MTTSDLHAFDGPTQLLGTRTNQWRLAFPSSVVGSTYGTAFAVPVPSQTRPATNLSTGVAVFEIGAANQFLVMPFGVGSDNQTFSMRAVSWSYCGALDVWIPTVLWSCPTVTVGTTAVPNVTGGLFADTIATLSPDMTISSTGAKLLQPGTPDNTPAGVFTDGGGGQLFSLEFTKSGGTITSANALVREI